MLDACSNTDYDSIRNQIVKAHTGQILARMRDDQDHLVELSKSLKSSMKDHMEILCRLAYNYGMIIKTHDQVWQTHTSPTGCEVPTAFVDVVGDIEGHVCQGFSNRYIVALNVFPALFCSREENPANMGLVEKSWVVADRL